MKISEFQKYFFGGGFLIERILELMTSRGVKAATLTRDAGLNHSSINSWKTGKAKPSYGALVKIANYFGVSVEYLEGKTDDPASQDKKKQPLSNAKAAEYLKQKLAGTEFVDESGEITEKGLDIILRFIDANQDMLRELLRK